TSTGVTVTVANVTGTKWQATITSSEVPPTVDWDPAAATQQQYGVDVTVKNISNATWPANTELHYRWMSNESTPTFLDGPAVTLGTTLAVGASKTIRLMVTPPALPDGVDSA